MCVYICVSVDVCVYFVVCSIGLCVCTTGSLSFDPGG